jgi:uncharacterized membrane protein
MTARTANSERRREDAHAFGSSLNAAPLSVEAVLPTDKPAIAFGRRIYGLGVLALGLSSLAFGQFDPGQPVPEHFPFRTVFAYVAGALMVIAATAVEWRRTAAWGSAVLAVYFAFFVVILLDGPLFLTHYREFGIYEEISMQFAIALGGLIVFASTASINVDLSSRLTHLCQLAFGVCTLIWGGAHFIYMNLTAPLVPKWLPPGQTFWGYVTGVCFIAAALAILTGVQVRRAAILLTAMLASFGLLVNDRILLTGLSSHWNWSESALNLALIGVAWVVSDSLGSRGEALVGRSRIAEK